MPTSDSALNPLFTDTPRYVGHQDANWDAMSFDLDADLALAMKNASFVESTDPDLAKYCLSPPTRVYILKSAASGTNPLAWIDFGTNETDKIYVRRSDENSVYTTRLDEIPTAKT